MMLPALREEVCEANRQLARFDLVTLTWGNVSGFDRAKGLVVIKPSGVPYRQLTPDDMVVVDLDGEIVEGRLKPSSDTPTHLILYREFPHVGGVTHTHSRFATMFAQARRAIPCLGTTHADYFFGAVPVTRALSKREVVDDYEGATGRAIVERFATLDPLAVPAVLAAGHAPFAWGHTAANSVHCAVALEAVAEMAFGAWQLNPDVAELEPWVMEKHYQRKHGPSAYYGQQ